MNYEILAPAGAEQQLKAAVRCGADAVYLGTGNFNARRNADNFCGDALDEAVKYCHLRNVKVFVTLNTLIFDKELNDLCETVKRIAKSNADGIIVQDFATVQAINNICPQMPIHASTQMAVHNIAGAKLLEKQGFSRIVLARELSFEEIKAIRNNVNCELEVFVHGAHCMGASGNCYLSAMLGDRSGNRGLCAQGCRLNWVSQHGREYALSLKDMSYLESIKSLADIGINSFKIEGRMKRPEYVAAAVTSLKKALNNERYDKEILRSVFSRSGFTDGYLKGNRQLSMFGYRQKEDVTSATSVLKELDALYKSDIHPTPCDAVLTLSKDKPCVLTLSAMGKTACVMGDVAEEPRNAPLIEEIAKRNISKLGDTAFYLKNFTFNNPDNLTLSASAVNSVRRLAVSQLETEIAKPKYKINNKFNFDINQKAEKNTPTLRVRLEKLSQYSSVFENAEFITLPINEIINNKDEITQLPVRVICELPSLIYPLNESLVLKQLAEVKETGITHGATGNIGGIELLKQASFTIHGTHGLNITNSISAEEYRALGVEDITLSFELTEKSIKSFNSKSKLGIYVYGYLPLMLMRACPQKNFSGCGDCNGFTALTDRRGKSFPLICHQKQYSVLHNSVPLYVGDKNITPTAFTTLYFTTEAKEQCEEIYNAFIKHKTIDGEKTNGLFFRELL